MSSIESSKKNDDTAKGSGLSYDCEEYQRERDELVAAVKSGNLEKAKELLQLGVDPNARERVYFDKPCLTYATEQQNTDMVRELLTAGADPDMCGWRDEKCCPFTIAVSLGNFNLVKQLIDGRGLHQGGYINSDAIFKAVELQRKDLVELLLESGADPHSTSRQDSEDIFHYAIRSRIDNSTSENETYIDILKMFLNRDTSVSYPYNDNYSDLEDFHPAKAVLEFGNVAALRLFIEHGLKLKKCNVPNPLHCAAKNRSDVFEYLVSHTNFDINELDSEDYSVLHLAVHHNNVKAVEILVHLGVDLETQNWSYETPLVTAVQENYLECLELLLEAGANVNHDLRNGLTPWYFAASQNNYAECFETLLAHGGDIVFDEHLIEYEARVIEPKTMEVLLRYIALQESKRGEINPGYYELMIEYDSIRKDSCGLDYLNKCRVEIELLKTSILHESTTFYEILTSEIPCTFYRDKKIIDILEPENLMETFRAYGSRICDIFKKAKSNADLEEGKIRGLNRILPFDVRSFHMIGENILKRLYPQDLRNLSRV